MRRRRRRFPAERQRGEIRQCRKRVELILSVFGGAPPAIVDRRDRVHLAPRHASTGQWGRPPRRPDGGVVGTIVVVRRCRCRRRRRRPPPPTPPPPPLPPPIPRTTVIVIIIIIVVISVVPSERMTGECREIRSERRVELLESTHLPSKAT